MIFDTSFTKENLNMYLKELAKEFRKLNGTAVPAEIILIGGAAILANYGFCEMTYDIDAVVRASSVMEKAINRTSDIFIQTANRRNMRLSYSANFDSAKIQLFGFIEGFYNRNRIHSSINFKSPVDFENLFVSF